MLIFLAAFLKAVNGPDQEEHGQCHDQKTDNCINEDPVVDSHSVSGLGIGQGSVWSNGIAGLYGEVKVFKIDPAQQPAKGGHENIIDEGIDNGAE